MIYVLKSTAGQERVVAEILYREAKNQGAEIYSVFYSTALKGYILVEADSPGTIDNISRSIPKTRGLLLKRKGDLSSAGTISLEDLETIIVPKKVVTRIHRGDLIELIAGPFKSEKARIVRIDKDKNEVTVELIEAAVPIPITVRGDDVKILKSVEEDEK